MAIPCNDGQRRCFPDRAQMTAAFVIGAENPQPGAAGAYIRRVSLAVINEQMRRHSFEPGQSVPLCLEQVIKLIHAPRFPGGVKDTMLKAFCHIGQGSEAVYGSAAQKSEL